MCIRDSYERVNHHADVLIVGAGPSGIQAARVSAETGHDVMVLDMQESPGGHLLFHPRQIDGLAASDWVSREVGELQARENVTWLQSTTATGYYDHNMVIAVQHEPAESWLKERLWHIRASKVVIATGAVERPLIFPGNDRPGVMLADAAVRYIRRFAAVPGKRVLIYTNNSTPYAHLETFKTAGIEIQSILDLRKSPSEAELSLARNSEVPVIVDARITGVQGRSGVKGVTYQNGAGTKTVRCDFVCHSGGWNPLIHLYSHAGGRSRFEQASAAFVPGERAQGANPILCANGTFSLAEGLKEATDVANTLFCESVGNSACSTPATPATEDEVAYRIDQIWPEKGLKGNAFVDFQNDVTTADIALAVRENFQSIC